MTKLPKGYLKFKKKHPEVYAAYETLGKTAADGGPLDAKTRELIKLGMSAARGSESAVVSHVHRAREAGASAEEIEHAITLGINTLGFPAMMTALSWAWEVLEKTE